MIFINNLLIMFAIAIFTSTAAIKDLNKKFHGTELIQKLVVKQDFAHFAHHNELVLAAYHEFETNLKNSSLSDAEVELILGAALFAAEKHRFQTRKNALKTPHIINSVGVANNILTIAEVTEPKILIAALLHDTLEDTETTFEEIQERYGSEVAGCVRELTDKKEYPKQVRKELQVINAPYKSEGAVLIELADQLYNLIDLSKELPYNWTQERSDEYFRWVNEIVKQLPSGADPLKTAIGQVSESYWEKRGLTFDHTSGFKSSNFSS